MSEDSDTVQPTDPGGGGSRHNQINTEVLDLTLAGALLRLDQFASGVANLGFEDAVKRLVPPVNPAEPFMVLVAAIAESISSGFSGGLRGVLMKSLQETFFSVTGCDPDIPAAKVATRFTDYARVSGSKGVLMLFLSLCTFEAAWLLSAESFQASAQSEDEFVRAAKEAERRCTDAVTAAFHACEKWPALTQDSAEAIIRATVSDLARTKRE
jgi:hypothetical protein